MYIQLSVQHTRLLLGTHKFFCQLQGDCGNFTHPDGPMLRSNRIRSYVITRTVNRECVGSSIYSLETYLIIDDARETDAGTYQVKVIPQLQRGYATEEQVNVSIGG